MSAQENSATKPCENCGGLIRINPEKIAEGQSYTCHLCGENFTFDKDYMDAINADLAMFEQAIRERKKKRGTEVIARCDRDSTIEKREGSSAAGTEPRPSGK